jgi:glutamate/aspartate transport system permease protein
VPALDVSVVWQALPYLGSGLWYSIELTAIAASGGVVIGTLLAVARLSRARAVRVLAGAYVTLMRSIPLVLVLFWFYFLSPLLLQSLQGRSAPLRIGAERSAIVTFVLFEAAYFCEIVRAGIRAVAAGQWDAARALGLSERQTMCLVVLPQAFRSMLPVFLTQVIVLFQDTSLVYVLSVTDFLGAASKIAQRDSRLVEMYLFVAAVYLGVCWTLSRGAAALNERTKFVR